MSAVALHDQGCIFCRRHDGGFRSQEHVLPETLGNKTLILPAGVVCDRCNTGPLSLVDRALLDLPHISMMRVLTGQESKKRKRPTSNVWQGVGISSPKPGHIAITHTDPGGPEVIQIVEQLGGGRVRAQMKLTGSKPVTRTHYRGATRGLWKAVLECVYLDSGEAVFDARFDAVRDMVRGACHARGFVLIFRSGGPPTTELKIEYDFYTVDEIETLAAGITICGRLFVTELLHREYIPGKAFAENLNADLIEF